MNETGLSVFYPRCLSPFLCLNLDPRVEYITSSLAISSFARNYFKGKKKEKKKIEKGEKKKWTKKERRDERKQEVNVDFSYLYLGKIISTILKIYHRCRRTGKTIITDQLANLFVCDCVNNDVHVRRGRGTAGQTLITRRAFENVSSKAEVQSWEWNHIVQ